MFPRFAAIRFLQQAYELDNADAATSFYLGVTKRVAGELDESVGRFDEAAELLTAGLLTDVYTQMGIAYHEKKDVQRAIRSFKKALDINPFKQELWFYLATVYDEHYADPSVAELYYEKFLRVSKEEKPEMREYASKRLEALKESIHFRKVPRVRHETK